MILCAVYHQCGLEYSAHLLVAKQKKFRFASIEYIFEIVFCVCAEGKCIWLENDVEWECCLFGDHVRRLCPS